MEGLLQYISDLMTQNKKKEKRTLIMKRFSIKRENLYEGAWFRAGLVAVWLWSSAGGTKTR